MTDTTHEAPERIWAWETLNCNGQWTIAEGDGVEYVRADIAQAAVAAKLREAAELMVIHRAFAVEEHGERSLIVADMDSRRHSILALIPADAQAALDRALLAEVRAVKDSLTAAYIELAAERERCAEVAQRCADLADTNGDYLLICNVVAAIREGGE